MHDLTAARTHGIPAALTADADAVVSGVGFRGSPALDGLHQFPALVSDDDLLGLLAEITGNEPSAALERLPILVGVAHAHFGDDALLDVLSAGRRTNRD